MVHDVICHCYQKNIFVDLPLRTYILILVEKFDIRDFLSSDSHYIK